MPCLIVWLGDYHTDTAASQQCPVGAGGVRLVAADTIWSSTGTPAIFARDPQVREQMRKGRRIPRLPRTYEHHQWQSVPIDDLVDLGRQAAARAADRVVRRLDLRIRVIRPSPPVWRVRFVAC